MKRARRAKSALFMIEIRRLMDVCHSAHHIGDDW